MKCLIITFLLFVSSYLFGTPQVKDRLVYENISYILQSDDYFLQYPLEKLYSDSLISRIFFNQSINGLSMCWRGYTAEWEIVNNKLYLTKLETCGNENGEIIANLSDGFASKCNNNKVFADWVSGEIYFTEGDLLYYSNSGGEVYETHTLFIIEKGICKEVKQCENSKQESIFSNGSENLSEFIWSRIDPIKFQLTDSIEDIRVLIQITSGKTINDFSIKIFKGYNEYFDSLALNVFKQLPEWDVYFKNCQILNVSSMIPVKFN